MAASAYAAALSLMHVLDNIQHPVREQLDLGIRNQVKTLHGKVSFFCDFLEAYSGVLYSTDKEDLAMQIGDAADEAEQIIDSHVVDQLSQRYADEIDMRLSSFSEDLEKIIDKIESIKEELMVFKDEITVKKLQPRISLPTDSSGPRSSGKNTMVGFDEQLVRIMDVLTGHNYDRQIVPIIGMGGIGKTTLAHNVFDDQCIVDHFDERTWVTISQEYSLRGILVRLLDGQGNNRKNESSAELREKLYKKLYGRRYLIVMDDVWNSEVWDDLKPFLPNNGNGSRIIVTTRLSNVAISLGRQNTLSLNFLGKDKSWELFCNVAFNEGVCPPELVESGKKIAESCRGLPLAIVVTADWLSNSNMTQEYWEFVAENGNADSGDDEHFLNMLSLSYNNLPIHLKPCFLYMRVFPKGGEISVSKLIRYWVAEGFVKPIIGKSLEEVANKYLMELIAQNLILVHKLTSIGEIKTCKIGDLVKDFCLREHEKEHLFRISRVQVVDVTDQNRCFLCTHHKASTRIYLPQFLVASQHTSIGRCFACDVCLTLYSQFDRLRLVRSMDRRDDGHAVEFLQSTILRYLDIRRGCQLIPSSLPLIWNLQTLIVNSGDKPIDLPSEIWEMPQLRHLEIFKAIFRDPPVTGVDKKDFIVLENLQALSFIENFRCLEEIPERIPNLKKLDLSYQHTCKSWSYYLLSNLENLHKLESLFLHCNNSINLKEIAFPRYSLTKLCLDGCNIPWEEMAVIGSLEYLKVLKIMSNSGGPKWDPIDGGFQRLKLLKIHNSDLVFWNAESFHFPILEILVLQEMHYLVEIPSGIGEISMLHSLRLVRCTESIVKSAVAIIEEQQSWGKENLQLHVEDCDSE